MRPKYKAYKHQFTRRGWIEHCEELAARVNVGETTMEDEAARMGCAVETVRAIVREYGDD